MLADVSALSSPVHLYVTSLTSKVYYICLPLYPRRCSWVLLELPRSIIVISHGNNSTVLANLHSKRKRNKVGLFLKILQWFWSTVTAWKYQECEGMSKFQKHMCVYKCSFSLLLFWYSLFVDEYRVAENIKYISSHNLFYTYNLTDLSIT
jgi:hypothetical protein